MKDITVEELKNKINSGNELFILDVREGWEHEEACIEGSRNFSLYSIPENHDELNDWKEKEIIIHCKSGKRSKTAQQILTQNGFNNTLNLLGGFEAWANN